MSCNHLWTLGAPKVDGLAYRQMVLIPSERIVSKWWARQDSNLQPDRYERPALTIELQAPPRGGRGWAAGNGARFVYRA